MNVLLIKTSSLGDVLHTLPALTDAGLHIADIKFTWVVEEAFSEVPAWHPLVSQVIPVALRRWRKQPLAAWRSGEWQNFRKQLQAEQYDYVLDAQGLLKSAFLAYFARGTHYGLDWQSAWEPLATLVYQRKYAVLPEQHAILRMRQLFAQVFGYAVPVGTPNYGIDKHRLLPANAMSQNYLVFLHGTTWPTKHYPESYWHELAKLASDAGYRVKLPWGNVTEYERAQRITHGLSNCEVLPKLNLREIAAVLAGAKAAIAVDTGLGHLAAALSVPTLSLYGPTNPALTGTLGEKQIHLSAQFPCAPCLQKQCTYTGEHKVEPPCFGSLPPKLVWERLINGLGI